jgi:ADP-ribose pyrophosphatase YjhB (NUDIX family)
MMNEFDEKEFLNLCNKLNTKPNIDEVTLLYKNESFFNKMKKGVQTDRRGEVVFCVIRPDGKIITTTCTIYPEGIFRIPTGGIRYGEDVIEAAFREVREELGLEVEITGFAGVLKIRFQHAANSFMFYSYIFIMKETGGKLLEDAEDDEISEVREVDLEGLRQTAARLADIKGSWGDWGRFRHITTKKVYDFLSYSFTVKE